MAEVNAEATDTSSLEHAASLFERMDSDTSEETDADESQQEVVGDEQPEQLETDEVVEESTDDSTDDEELDPAAVAEPRKLKVKLPEGEQELPEDEVVKGYLRQNDYTRKTQALAEEKKSHQAEFDGIVAQRKEYADRITQLAEALKQHSPSEPDWDKLQQESPDEFASTWAAWQRHTQQLAKIEAARQAAVNDVAKDQIKHLAAHLESERAKLIEAIPSWKDEAVATRERDALFKYAQTTGGYTESELAEVYDHRVMTLLRKAYLYDKSQSAKPAAQAKIQAVKTATPGPALSTRKPQATERTIAKQRLAKTGSIRDAAAFFEQMDRDK